MYSWLYSRLYKPQTSEYTRKSSSGWKTSSFSLFLRTRCGERNEAQSCKFRLDCHSETVFLKPLGRRFYRAFRKIYKDNKTCTTSTDKIVQLRLDFAERPNRPLFDNGSSFRSKDSSRKIRHGLRSLFRRNHNEIFAVVIP